MESYEGVKDHMVNGYIPRNSYELDGNVLEYYPPVALPGTVHLYFPVKKTKKNK